MQGVPRQRRWPAASTEAYIRGRTEVRTGTLPVRERGERGRGSHADLMTREHRRAEYLRDVAVHLGLPLVLVLLVFVLVFLLFLVFLLVFLLGRLTSICLLDWLGCSFIRRCNRLVHVHLSTRMMSQKLIEPRQGAVTETECFVSCPARLRLILLPMRA